MKTNIEFWRELWQQGRTGWDIGGPHPGLERILNLAAHYWLPSAPDACIRILVPGCGRSHDPAAIASRSIRMSEAFAHKPIEIIAADFAPEAIEAARKEYDDLQTDGLKFLVQDSLTDPPAEQLAYFDFIFDRAMLCALIPENRLRYLSNCRKSLRPNGLFLSIPFTTIERNDPGSAGPPFEIPISEFATLMNATGLSMIHQEVFSGRKFPDIIKEEALTISKINIT